MKRKIFEKGQKYISNHGTLIELLHRIDKTRWKCRLVQSGLECTVNQTQLRNKQGFSTPMCRTVYGIGYFGVGDYACRLEDGSTFSAYSVWANLLKRCYTDYKGNSCKTNYKDVVVCDEWHNYQNFAKWYEENTVKFKQYGVTPFIDKDLKIKDNFLYSPETCLLLPNILNCTVRGRVTTSIYQGITERNGKYTVRLMFKGKNITIGRYGTLQDAIDHYQAEKVKNLRNLADEFKHVLSTEAYNVLYNFEKERC